MTVVSTARDSLEVFIHREDVERFIEEVCGDDPEVATELHIEEREFEAETTEDVHGDAGHAGLV